MPVRTTNPRARVKRFARILICLLAVLSSLLAAPQKPKLVLVIVIDQFRYDYLLRFRSDYNAGLARLLDHGAVFTDAHYLHAATVTAVGHSTILSGATPSISGIIANEWYDRESGQTVTSVSDPQTNLIGGKPGRTGSSPRRLLVSTVGDELKMRHADSRVIGISIKDRSAILPVGHMADAAFWFDQDSNNWVTSSYYRESLPEWAIKVNAGHPASRYTGAKWLPIDAKNSSAKPFCSMGGANGDKPCASLEATPWGNEMIEEFAERALEGEGLGARGTTDLLSVSFSSNDYVGHAVGPDDPSVRDISIRTDRLIGKLLDLVDHRAGPGNTLVVLTADHGVAPVPEVNVARKMPGGRLSAAALLQKANDALANRFGPGKWILPNSSGMIYLNLDLIHTMKLDPAAVERVAAEAISSEKHVARVYTREQLLHGQVQQDQISRAFSLGFFAPRSGDIFVLPEPYFIFAAKGATHGEPYDYDNHVPVIFYGAGIKGASYSRRIAVNDISPTLAAILQVEQPSGSIGQILAEVLQ